MARKPASLPGGGRLSDLVSLSLLFAKFPGELVDRILQSTGRQSRRQRQLPARLMTYYVIALALYMEVAYEEVLRCLLEGLSWLGWSLPAKWANKSAVSNARLRLGAEPLRQLYEQGVQPIATRQTRGAWFHRWRLVSLDGSTLDVADTPDNEATFGRPGASRGQSGFPQLRFVSLAEVGTRVLFATAVGPYTEAERTLAGKVMPWLGPEMLCLADRGFFSFALWEQARETGAQLVWRVTEQLCLPVLELLADGSYLSKIYPSPSHRRRDRGGVVVRVVEYELPGVEGSTARYRLLTSILDAALAPAQQLAELYRQRWEIELAFDEFKTHLRGRRIVLRSKTPELVMQEFYGLLLAHFLVRQVLHEAALQGDVDPDELSFVHTVRVLRRKAPQLISFSPSEGRRRLSPDVGRDLGRTSQLESGPA
jgi:hypothetical protein